MIGEPYITRPLIRYRGGRFILVVAELEGVVTEIDVEKTRNELLKLYPESHVKVADDNREMVAEITGEFAVAVIDRSQAHFHLKTKEVYEVLRGGTLYVACGGSGHVLRKGDKVTIEPGQIHFARAVGEPVWIGVTTVPPWSADDHFVL